MSNAVGGGFVVNAHRKKECFCDFEVSVSCRIASSPATPKLLQLTKLGYNRPKTICSVLFLFCDGLRC
jgi:hypothetical protein